MNFGGLLKNSKYSDLNPLTSQYSGIQTFSAADLLHVRLALEVHVQGAARLAVPLADVAVEGAHFVLGLVLVVHGNVLQ